MPTMPPNGARIVVFPSIASASTTAASSTFTLRFSLIQRARRSGPLAMQFAGAFKILPTQRQRRLGLQQFGPMGRCVELDQGRALLDRTPLLEPDGDDPTGDLGTHHHGFVGQQRSHGVDGPGDRIDLDFRRLDRHAARRRTGFRGTRRSNRFGQRPRRKTGDHET